MSYRSTRAFLKIARLLIDKQQIQFLRKRCYQKVAGHVWFGYLPRYGVLCRHARPPLTFSTALTTSPPPSPPVSPSFILSSYYLTNISKFMRFYLISLACTSKPTPPFPLSRSFSSLLGTPSCALRAGNGNPPGFFPSVFLLSPSLFLFTVLYSFSPLAYFNCIYIHIYFSYRRRLKFCLACT